MSKAIENGNSPAMPFEYEDIRGGALYLGMTKRETMAMHIMAGIFAAGDDDPVELDRVARYAHRAADALLGVGDE